MRIAKVNQDPVAQIARDVTVFSFNGGGAARPKGTENFPHVLGVELPGHRRRANEIDKHHRDGSPFSDDVGLDAIDRNVARPFDRRWLETFQLTNGLEETLAVAER